MNVTTTNVANGTTLYWTVTPSGDFGTSSGSFSISSNAGSFTVTPTADVTTEGPETGTIQIRTGSTSGTIVASDTFTINDTSTAPAQTYSVTANNGDEIFTVPTASVTTTNVSDGTTLYWNVTPTADFDVTSGSFTINSNAGSITLTPTKDYGTGEGDETYTINIRTGSTSGTIVATDTATLSDTAKSEMYVVFISPSYYVVQPSGSGTYHGFYWENTLIGNTSSSPWSINYNGHTYTRGTPEDSVSDKNGTTTYYTIIRS
jgi:hypothetical protein